MSNPSGQLLMQQVIEDETLAVAIRLQAIRESSFRPTLTFLLRLIRQPATPPTIRACAVLRYNQQLAIKELTRDRGKRRSAQVEKLAANSTPQLV